MGAKAKELDNRKDGDRGACPPSASRRRAAVGFPRGAFGYGRLPIPGNGPCVADDCAHEWRYALAERIYDPAVSQRGGMYRRTCRRCGESATLTQAELRASIRADVRREA